MTAQLERNPRQGVELSEADAKETFFAVLAVLAAFGAGLVLVLW